MKGLQDGNAAAVGPLAKWKNDFSRTFQYYLDRSTLHPVQRWLGTVVAAAIYILRVYYVQGFYVVSYGLGIYILNLLIGFLLPKVGPELENSDGASLPTRGSDEFKPCVRCFPEFKFWYSITKAFCVAFIMAFFSLFDVPVFWPILLCYWMLLFLLTTKRQIMHMIKYRYIPFNLGKQVSEDKFGDRIAALHQLVAPFGKRDTASVLMEAIGYIKFLQNQIEALSAPSMKSSRAQPKPIKPEQMVDIDGSIESRRDLRSRGLCLVPLSCISFVTNCEGGGWPSSDYQGAT